MTFSATMEFSSGRGNDSCHVIAGNYWDAVMLDPRIDFDTIEWEQPEPAMRSKTIVRGDAQFRLVEFDRGFQEPDWCHAGHHGFVLEGKFQIEFDADVVVFQAGDGLYIPPGPSCRHKAMILSYVVRLMLIEPLFEPEN